MPYDERNRRLPRAQERDRTQPRVLDEAISDETIQRIDVDLQIRKLRHGSIVTKTIQTRRSLRSTVGALSGGETGSPLSRGYAWVLIEHPS